MRIIVSEEVLEGLPITKQEGLPFECFAMDCKNFTYNSSLPDPQTIKLFILPIGGNVKCDDKKLFEICWPVSKHDFNNDNSKIMEHVNELIKMQSNFSGDTTRHLRNTAELLEKSLRITELLYNNDYTQEQLGVAYKELHRIVSIK
jgi:hypothetical protein